MLHSYACNAGRDLIKLHPPSPLCAAIYTATTVLSLVIANNAAAAIVFPIAATVAVKVSRMAGC